jgi:hypothetical protein
MLCAMAQDRRGRRRGGAGAASTANTDTLRFPLAGSSLGPRGAAGSHVAAAGVAFPLTVAAVHLLVVQVAASLAYHLGTANPLPSPPYGTVPPPLTGLAHYLVEPLRLWDGLWYKLIAEQGYPGSVQSAKAAFWPLFPWVMDYGSRLTGWSVDTVGYLVSNLAFAGALVLLYRLVALDFDAAVARRTLWAIALFPTALFFSAVYTESLFLLLVVGALLAARLGRWWIAGLVGALAALTRSYGVLLLIPFAVLFVQQYRLDVRRWFPKVIATALPVLGPAIFGWHLERVQGNWRAFIDVQGQWNRYASNPVDTLRCGISSCFNLGGEPDGASWGWLTTLLHHPTWATLTSQPFRLSVANSDTLELVCTLLFLALAVIGLRTLPLYQSAYLIPGLVIPLYQPSSVHALMSMPRFGLTLFPLFVVLALLIRGRFAVPVMAVSTLLLVLLTIQFTHWYWVS